MTVQNGVPWWYFFKHGGPFDGRRIAAVDPSGTIDDAIERERIVGCIVYPAGGDDGAGRDPRRRRGTASRSASSTARTASASRPWRRCSSRAGFKSYVLDDIRGEIWLKLWGNVSFNPISALTHQTLAGICRNPHTRELAASMMREAQEIGEKLGDHVPPTRSRSASRAPKASASTRPRCCRSVEAGRTLRSKRWSARSSNSGGSPNADPAYRLGLRGGEGSRRVARPSRRRRRHGVSAERRY